MPSNLTGPRVVSWSKGCCATEEFLWVAGQFPPWLAPDLVSCVHCLVYRGCWGRQRWWMVGASSCRVSNRCYDWSQREDHCTECLCSDAVCSTTPVPTLLSPWRRHISGRKGHHRKDVYEGSYSGWLGLSGARIWGFVNLADHRPQCAPVLLPWQAAWVCGHRTEGTPSKNCRSCCRQDNCPLRFSVFSAGTSSLLARPTVVAKVFL